MHACGSILEFSRAIYGCIRSYCPRELEDISERFSHNESERALSDDRCDVQSSWKDSHALDFSLTYTEEKERLMSQLQEETEEYVKAAFAEKDCQLKELNEEWQARYDLLNDEVSRQPYFLRNCAHCQIREKRGKIENPEVESTAISN